ncbi:MULTISPECIES: spore germination protein [unclassified Paenibacillus]|uniref:spore germination protein n=1 Tax=unclassified Paenibacillus TaxID=185978 RepID=UPI001AE79A8E|nr:MULTISPECIES: spore germination protein [unclassified Paenibacillus]MBP1155541.1 spore germination protein KA [Paenibacillus sp. PvP091]MBP1169073.1 spore germination protein KA [Paenibacillus sp. PvR098]MBP2440101.1 spore germination protein KA [Paenibacillus sp. PvP052]
MGTLWKQFKKASKHSPSNLQNIQVNEDNKKLLKISLRENLQEVKEAFGNSCDLVIREFLIGSEGNIRAAIIYTDGLADSKETLEALMAEISDTRIDKQMLSNSNPISLLKDFSLAIGQVKSVYDFEALLIAVLSGDTVILLDGQTEGLIASQKGWNDRSVTEPESQSMVRGPREGFTETLRTNTALIRRKIKDPNLWLENKQIGRVTRTDIGIMYIKGIVNDKVLEEVRARLDRIDIDAILESGYIEELIQDETWTPFPTMYNTERPDAVAASLLEGRVAILVDGTPFVLLVPALFTQFYQASEDYYQRADFATLLRVLRYISFFIALLVPSFYIAVTTYHHELLPTALLIGLASQREGVPFPAFIEALMMEITFEILREAGVRMPKTIGQSVSIVGTLVIGQAAVEAGLVSAAMVMVVSITAISNFVIPSFNMAISIRMLRFFLMGLAATFGLYGITIGLIVLVLHLCSLRSFGVPYMSPFAPFNAAGQKDTIFRFPQWALYSRPRLISQNNVIRAQNRPTPKPETE